MAHEKQTEILNRHVSSLNVLFVKLHNYHWFVKGPDFFTLHEKFEELYNETADHIDELAERLLAVKGRPVGTMREYLELSSLQEASGEDKAEQMVQALSKDFDVLIEELKGDIETLEEEVGDEATADMLIEIRQSFEKHNWMLRSYLGQ
ncbi:DNA starvation/stationary phase protection protein [Alteribacter lacisalsi]|uniref:DNA starvation/stationary phase protection protein n=1 Tax=Alteribacter lacisalsi TaxID=2045244 RepID=A0A2W0H7P2_9BACI|nr:Dps family protein [Alteribacter lacisalsi]PYZ97883.1 DNA starvation/stationary phase protection protein [Alteribacter lacisalsi]